MIYGALIMLGGLFCIFCACKDYDWFMNNYKARPFIKLFGREGARRFYIGLGIFILFCGLIAALYR